MTTDHARHAVCLMVPAGTWNLTAIAGAVAAHEPGAAIVAVWCGDPHQRPSLPDGVTWCDRSLDEATGIGWNRLLVASTCAAYELHRTAAAVARLLDVGVEVVVVLRVGSAAVVGPFASMATDAPVTLVPHSLEALPADGCAPGESDIVREGRSSTSIMAVRSGAQPALHWLGEHLAEVDSSVGPWLDRLVDDFGARWCNDPSIGAGSWRDCERTPALLDLDHLDADRSWHFEFGERPARVRLSASPYLAAAVSASADQIEGQREVVRLPGGLVVDDAMRSLTREHIAQWRLGQAELFAEPFGGHNSEFVAWMERSDPWTADIGRYWVELHRTRADLASAFARPQSVDADRYREWIDASWHIDPGRSLLVRDHVGSRAPIRSAGFDPSGINVLGYLDFDQSQGHIARRLIEALTAAHVPVAELNHHRSMGSRRPVEVSSPREATYATNLVVVNADQLEFVVADHGSSLLAGRRTIGYWFWELEHVPDAMVRAIDVVDEIWAGSQFIADAFSHVTDKPVHRVSLPVQEPRPSPRDRASFGLPPDRFVFLATFDQFSVPERKNPFGVIRAFTEAFNDGEGPLLWIKTMNGAKGWRNHERLLLAAAGRSDIIVWDEHLSRPDQMAVLNAADCLVTLHRSEGLGLHCAEAMWLGKPVIATRYSGNLDFMDDSCSALIDYQLVPVRHGEGIYPPEALWADPDLAQASAWMRRLATEPELAQRLGASARARMQQQPSLASTGEAMARLAGIAQA